MKMSRTLNEISWEICDVYKWLSNIDGWLLNTSTIVCKSLFIYLFQKIIIRMGNSWTHKL